MRIEDFGMVLADEISLILGSEYKIEYKEVSKNNGILYHALLIRKEDEKVSPSIFIDGFYQAYLDGVDRNRIANDIIRFYRANHPPKSFDVSFFTDFSRACKHLAFKVTNYEKNKKNLIDVPYKKLEDLAMVPVCLLTNEFLGEGSITIKNEHLRYWEISFDELWENVWENVEQIAPIKCKSIWETIGKAPGHEMFDWTDLPQDIYVVTNAQDMHGAAAAFYPGFLERLSSDLESDLVVLPSSVHETIVMRKPKGELDLEALLAIVREVNKSVLGDEDFLSESIYLYSRADNSIKAMKPMEKTEA